MSAIDEEYVSVNEAAALLRVASSTIRRWIRQGDLPAYRIGKRRLALRREDLHAMIAPARSYAEQVGDLSDIEQLERGKPTPEEVRQGLEAMERLQRHSKQIFAGRGGKPFPPSWKIINDMRDEPFASRKLTPEEVQRGLEALERIEQINKEILARRGGRPFDSSVDIIREMREERTRQLG